MTARVVGTPSATLSMVARTSASFWPLPMRSPTVRLRPSGLTQVVIRSPSPAKPANVAGCAPMAAPSRLISTSPRVTSAALALFPAASPSRIPAAIAITFLVAPRSEEHTSELQSHHDLVCRLLLEKKKKNTTLLRYAKKKSNHHTTEM